MDTSNIPKIFWYATSVCMLSATFGLLFIAYRSSTVSIEIADTKINLSSAIAAAKDIKNDLEKENERQKAVIFELQEKFKSVDVAQVIEDPAVSVDLKKLLKNSVSNKNDPLPRHFDPSAIDDLENKIQQAEKSIQFK